MKKTDKIAYRQKTVAELESALLALKKQLVETRAKFVTGNQKDTSVFKKIKGEIAFMLTLINQKQHGPQN